MQGAGPKFPRSSEELPVLLVPGYLSNILTKILKSALKVLKTRVIGEIGGCAKMAQNFKKNLKVQKTNLELS